jgi:hypothetical protein
MLQRYPARLLHRKNRSTPEWAYFNSLLVRNKGEHTERKPIWCSADTREQLQRYIGRERSQVDTQTRTKLEQLGDDDPIFLSRRKRQLEYLGPI